MAKGRKKPKTGRDIQYVEHVTGDSAYRGAGWHESDKYSKNDRHGWKDGLDNYDLYDEFDEE